MNLTRICCSLYKFSNTTSVILVPSLYTRSYTSIALANTLSNRCLTNKQNAALSVSIKGRCISSVGEKNVQEEEKPSILTKIFRKIPFISIEKTRLGVIGFMLYESIADKIHYVDFFEEFSLPDTFYSWFVVTELHIWLLTVRCMAEGEDGRYVRNKMIEALWSDVGLRVKKIGAANPSAMRKHVHELSEQLQAAFIAYDEGLQTDDTVLAGAIWRRMYQQKEADPEHLDGLIRYIRRQTRLLDNISKKDLFSQKPINWGSPVEKN